MNFTTLKGNVYAQCGAYSVSWTGGVVVYSAWHRQDSKTIPTLLGCTRDKEKAKKMCEDHENLSR